MSTTARRNTLFLSCMIYLALGLITAAVGPVIPDLAQKLNTSLAATGAVFTAIFLGALSSQLAVGPILDRIGQRPVLLGGVLLLGLGTIGLVISPSLALALAFAYLSGLGHGAIDLGASVLIAIVYAEKSVSALNLLNVFFGIGAVVGPALVGLVYRGFGSGVPALWIVAALILTPLLFSRMLSSPSRSQEQLSASAGAAIYRSPLLWMLGWVFLLYVGTESGIGGWATSYLQLTSQMSLDQAALITSGFWLALTVGRMTAAGLGSRFPSLALLTTCVLGAIVGSALFNLSQDSPWMSSLGILLIGFFFGPIYPTSMAITTSLFRSGPGKAASISAAMGSIGGTTLPWFHGILLTQVGPSAFTLATLAGGILMLGLVLLLRSNQKRTARLAVDSGYVLPDSIS